MGFFNHTDYVEMTVHFRCNLRCRHCMILDTMDWLRPADEREFSDLLEENRRTGRASYSPALKSLFAQTFP